MKIVIRSKRLVCRTVVLLSAAAMTLGTISRAGVASRYQQTNLVSDLPGAQIQDTNLVNAWGVSFGAGTPFWISDNGTGLSTLYAVTNDSSGSPIVIPQTLVVAIPPGAGQGTPTGTVFDIKAGFHGDIFLFVSEDGTISGWRPPLGTNAETLVPGSTNNVYKGMALATNGDGTEVLLASNFRQGTVDEYDTNLVLIGQFCWIRTALRVSRHSVCNRLTESFMLRSPNKTRTSTTTWQAKGTESLIHSTRLRVRFSDLPPARQFARARSAR